MINKVVIRVSLVLLIILSVVGVSLKTDTNQTNTIFLVDVSQSVQKYDEIENFINDSLTHMGKNDKSEIIEFANGLQVERILSSSTEEYSISHKLLADQTDVEKALKFAVNRFPKDANKRIVLITDGKETLGDSVQNVQLDDVSLKVYAIDSHLEKELQITDLELPQNLSVGQEVDIKVSIFSTTAQKVYLDLYNNRSLVGTKEVAVQKGMNKFIYSDTLVESGHINYKAELRSVNDTYTQNNSYIVNRYVSGPKQIMVVNGDSNESQIMIQVLNDMNVLPKLYSNKEVPVTFQELTKYKAIILNDVSIENIDPRFVDNLKMFVNDIGGGLFVTGGQNSFALGGYYQTTLEDLLPVNMEMKIDGMVPNLGLGIIIDKSGSMSGKKLAIAKSAAIKSVDSSKPKDYIGVMSFDSKPKWEVPMTEVTKKETIKKNINSIGEGGGTSIIPALNEMITAYNDLDVQLKHVILLTDGQAESRGYNKILEQFVNNQVTISTIAIGKSADKKTLNKIASTTGGRFYHVANEQVIPKIFTKETFLASKTYLNNETFYPEVNQSHDILSGIDQMPPLNGYISSSSKPVAKVLLNSSNEEPILAVFQSGLGHSAAWLSDISGQWSKDFLTTNHGVQVIKNTVEWVSSLKESQAINVSTAVDGEKITLKILDNEDDYYSYKYEVIDLNNNKNFDLLLNNDGVYEISIQTLKKGVNPFKINKLSLDNELIDSINYYQILNYSKEYDSIDQLSVNDALVNRYSGEYVINPADVFEKVNQENKQRRDITWYILFIAAILFIFDIANRRLNLLNNLINKIKRLSSNYQKDRATVEINKTREEIFGFEQQPDMVDKKQSKKTHNDKEALDVNRLLQRKNRKGE